MKSGRSWIKKDSLLYYMSGSFALPFPSWHTFRSYIDQNVAERTEPKIITKMNVTANESTAHDKLELLTLRDM